jgi:hypothetical protein
MQPAASATETVRFDTFPAPPMVDIVHQDRATAPRAAG